MFEAGYSTRGLRFEGERAEARTTNDDCDEARANGMIFVGSMLLLGAALWVAEVFLCNVSSPRSKVEVSAPERKAATAGGVTLDLGPETLDAPGGGRLEGGAR